MFDSDFITNPYRMYSHLLTAGPLINRLRGKALTTTYTAERIALDQCE
jgi:hypothetical protein